MSVSVEVVDQVDLGLPPGPIIALVSAVLDCEGIEGEVVVALVDEQTIEDLNREYRGLSEPTDVLSFRYAEEAPGWNLAAEAQIGEIAVCSAVVQRNAIEEGVSERWQFGWTLVHGALHLAGYDHERDQGEMRACERHLLERFAGLVEGLPPLSR